MALMFEAFTPRGSNRAAAAAALQGPLILITALKAPSNRFTLMKTNEGPAKLMARERDVGERGREREGERERDKKPELKP